MTGAILNLSRSLEFEPALPGAIQRMSYSEVDTSRLGLRGEDAQGIARIYDAYSADVYRYVRYRLDDPSLAEDIASEVFLRLLEAGERGRGPETNVRGWLLSTAAHIITDHLRRRYSRPAESLLDDAPDPAASPPSAFDERERRRQFRRAYMSLTSEQQHVLALRFGDGLSVEATAATMKKNVNAVKALQFRALAAMQRHIGRREDGQA